MIPVATVMLVVSFVLVMLAEVIRRHGAVADRLTRINTALEEISVWSANEAVERAETTLKDARTRQQKTLVAKLLGDPSSPGPTVEEAEQALVDARGTLVTAQRTRDALESQQRAAESTLGWAKSGLRDSIARVVHSEGAASAVLAQYLEARREVARIHEVLSLLAARNCLPAYWDTHVHYPPTNAEAPWRAALAALESDADAELP
jgi:hypothetical protein